ncbi:hypothetical protein [Tumidithrix elongata]
MNISHPQNSREAFKMITLALSFLKRDSPESNELINFLYTPDPRISDHLNQLRDFLRIKRPTKAQSQKAGYLLERILLLAFKGLTGHSELKNYQSASHQIDQLVSGDNTEWDLILDRLYLKENNQTYRTILGEAKATNSSVSVSQFARLCSIMTLELYKSVGLGVFFTINGAAGFPKRSQKSRTSCIRHARLCQVLFNARSGKKIVVLDKDDIFDLDKNGSLITILIRKIKELEENSGLPTVSVVEPMDIDLPNYLKDLI